MCDQHPAAACNAARRVLRDKDIRVDAAGGLREVRVRMKDDEAYIPLRETLLSYQQRLTVLERMARDRSYAGLGWDRRAILYRPAERLR
jgi:hypothetical protein